MADEAETIETTTALRPPYLPWKTFNTGIAAIKAATVPPVLDNTARPASMAGGFWRQFVAATKFFGLVEENGKTTDRFSELVNSHKTDGWASAIKEHLVPAYSAIIADVPLENGTTGQLDHAFKTRGGAENQVLRKSERFFLHVLSEAKISYSPRFSMRRESAGGRTRKKREAAAPDPKGAGTAAAQSPNPSSNTAASDCMLTYQLHFRRKNADGSPKVLMGTLTVPVDATDADCKIVEGQLAVFRIYAGTITEEP
jgi:hypothetical protein